MTEYVTDEEQVERIKKWWSDNGSSVIAGLIIGVGGLTGWRFYVDYNVSQSAEASAHFSDLQNAMANKQSDKAIEYANIVLDDYQSTPYADLSRLSLARIYVDNEQYEQAAQQLQLLVDSTRETGLEMIARKRLAAVQAQLGQNDQALQTLDVEYPIEFTAAIEELKGDILAAKGAADQAQEAYQKARLANPPSANPQFLQQKLDNLAGSIQTS